MDRRPVNRRDIKSRTRVNYTVFDEDIGSRYDYDDDDSTVPMRHGISRVGQLQVRAQMRRDAQLLRSQAAGTNSQREFIYNITVRNCARSGLDYILRQISESMENFRPIAPKVNQGHVEFILCNQDDAEAVRSLSRRIADRKSGVKLAIIVQRVPAPWEPLRSAAKICIENAVKSRYSAISNSVDLGDFGNDKEFEKKGFQCPLFKNEVVVHVSNVIARLFPKIQGLRLNGNRLRLLDYIATMVYAAPFVTELDLSSNAISRIEELDKIRGWRIEKLHLENNECVAKFNDADYASAIHNYFPRVNYLDGIFISQDPFKLSAQENDGFILPYKLGYYPDDNVREHVERFVLEYISLYDGPNGEQTRKTLMNAYDESATMTFAIHRLKDSFMKSFNYVPKGDDESFNNYIRSSHNILQMQKWNNYRDKIVYKGAMDIAVALSKLPLTTHIKDTFVLDFNFTSNEMVVFTLQGILRDGADAFKEDGDCKLFLRNFVVVSKDGGSKMAIVSDMLSLTPIGTERLERYANLLKRGAANAQQQPGTSASAIQQMRQMQSQSVNAMADSLSISKTSEMFNMLNSGVGGGAAGTSSSNICMPAPPPSTPQPPPAQPMENTLNYDPNDPFTRQEMIRQFCDTSKMKPEWSEKCLADCQWNFEAAGSVFKEMFMKNQIPPEAFR